MVQRFAGLAVRLAQFMVVEARLRLKRQEQQQQQIQREAEMLQAEASRRWAGAGHALSIVLLSKVLLIWCCCMAPVHYYADWHSSS